MTFLEPLSDPLKAAYHRAVPRAVRYPIGHARRDLLDRLRRLRADGAPLPPRRLLQTVQMTPWIDEYLSVGRASAEAVADALRSGPTALPPSARVLDFGCGLARTLRFLAARRDLDWRLVGCDVERESIAWCRGAFPSLVFHASWPRPPLPLPTASLDAVYAISVFTHFDDEEQSVWLRELARVVRPGGLAAISTMGPRAFGSFRELQTPERTDALERDGFVYDRGGDAFNQRGAFHTPDGLRRLAEPAGWRLDRSIDGGVDGFQDLHVLERRHA